MLRTLPKSRHASGATRSFLLGSPKQPDGSSPSPAAGIRALAGRHPETAFVIDEAFADFTQEASLLDGDPPGETLPSSVPSPSSTRSRACAWGPSLREKEVIDGLRALIPPWSVNTLAQAVGRPRPSTIRSTPTEPVVSSVSDGESSWRKLKAIPGLTVYPGEAKLPPCPDRPRRSGCPEIGAPHPRRGNRHPGLRQLRRPLTAGSSASPSETQEENARLCGFPPKSPGRRRENPCPAAGPPVIMFPGDRPPMRARASLPRPLCRILLQGRPSRVAPVQSPEHVVELLRHPGTAARWGGPRSSRPQAWPDRPGRQDETRSLLKPNSDTGSQVIVLGKTHRKHGVLGVYEGTGRPPFAAAKGAFDALAAEYDAIVMEGAGSPGEVNLKKRDIVNMNMALYAKAPVSHRR